MSAPPITSPGRITVRVTGMTCPACERRVTKALGGLPGVRSATASARRGRAQIVVDGVPPGPAALAAAVVRAGYTPGAPAWLSRDRRAWTVCLATAAAAAAVISVAFAAGWSVPTPGAGAAGPVLALGVGLAAGVSTCMAMIGGLVLGISASAPAAGTGDRVRSQLVFHAGRLAGFAAGGALLGAVGSAARLPDGVLAVAGLVAAAVMLLLGVRLTGLSPRVSGWTPALPASWSDRIGLSSARGAAAAGALTFLLPCGFTQAMQVYAISLGSAPAAALIMVAFALGTAPGLLGLGVLGGAARTAGAARTGGSAAGPREVDTRPVIAVLGVVVLAFAGVTGFGAGRTLGLGLPGFGSLRGAEVVAATVSPGVQVVDGVQVVAMRITSHGYAPDHLVVWAGVPIRWTVDVEAGYSCATALRVPAAKVSADVPQPGRHVVDVPALRAGTTPFTCAMGMYSGRFQAVERPAP